MEPQPNNRANGRGLRGVKGRGIVIHDISSWENLIDELDTTSFFWHPEWYSLFGNGVLTSDPEFNLKIPFLIKRKFFLKTLHSGPFGTYGGPIQPPSTIDIGTICQHLAAAASAFGAVKVVFNGNPWHNYVIGMEKCPFPLRWAETMAITPVPKDPLSGCSSACKRNYRKAVRAGVKLKFGEEEDVEVYYRMYRETAARQRGKMRYSLIFFNRLHQLKNVHLLMAYVDSQPIAGLWLLIGKGEVFYWHGASFTRWLHLRPNNFLHVEAIRLAYERGATWYNMGASLGKTSLMAFKASFGAKSFRYPVIKITFPMSLLRKWSS